MTKKTISLPALPALVAGRALKVDAAVAAERALEDARRLLACYDMTVSVMDEMPGTAKGLVAEVLHQRLAAANRKAKACQERLDDAAGFCRSLSQAASPVMMVEVSGPFFEMLSPYLDDAMQPVLETISRQVGFGCTADQVGAIFPRPRPTLAA